MTAVVLATLAGIACAAACIVGAAAGWILSNKAAREYKRALLAWLRSSSPVWVLDEADSPEDSFARLANAVERDEHLLPYTTAADPTMGPETRRAIRDTEPHE